MENVKKYNPFGIKDYYIVEKEGKKYFNYNDILLELSSNGYTPKSGLLFDMILNKEICGKKDILDLGCGYLGILGFIAYCNGAKSVDSIDYDLECVRWFNKLIKDNKLDNIRCFKSNYYENVGEILYDIILANPPQMPMLNGNMHDSGGIDGRKYILEIMEKSFKYLKENGSLYLLVFDFLGIDFKTNNEKNLMEIASDIGYSTQEIVFCVDKKLKPGSITYESISHINTVYPLYDFGLNEDRKCKIKIMRLDK